MEKTLLLNMTSEILDKYEAEIKKSGIHGYTHWENVYRNSMTFLDVSFPEYLYTKTKEEYARMFAVFAFYHDLGRKHDGICVAHAKAGVKLLSNDRDTIQEKMDLSVRDIDIILKAIEIHTSFVTLRYSSVLDDFRIEEAYFILLCLDSDRLDIDRVYPEIDLKYISTDVAKKLANVKNTIRRETSLLKEQEYISGIKKRELGTN